MKTVLSIALLLGVTGLTYGQQTINKSRSITNNLREKYTVVNTDTKTRQGDYVATLDEKPVAKGKYTNGKRSGEWNFYNEAGKLVQTYNYDNSNITFLDTADVKKARYILEKTDAAAVVSAPVKIGGSTYGIAPLTSSRDKLEEFVDDTYGAGKDVNYTHILTIDKQGRVVNHKVIIAVGDSKTTFTLNDNKLDADLTRFVPAKVNNQPVMSMVVVTSKSKTEWDMLSSSAIKGAANNSMMNGLDPYAYTEHQ